MVLLAVAFATPMQQLGWGQTSQLALVKALSHGTARIDRYHWETRDKAWYRGHFYSVKSPGLAFLTLPLYELVDSRAWSLSKRVAAHARAGGSRWHRTSPWVGQYGYEERIARATRTTIEDETPLAWLVGLLGTVAPAVVLVLLVRALAERIAPRWGTATGVALGLGTLVLPFSGLFFSHVLAACLGFAAFAVLWREREGRPRPRLVALAGLLAGLAVTCEYPLALVGAIVGAYGVSRGPVPHRALAYAAGALVGVAPLLAYNFAAFGTPLENGYAYAVAIQGATGHDVLGLNSSGFFGVGAPSLRVAAELLLAAKGLLVMSPLLAAGAFGVVLLHRSGRRAEALTIAAVGLAYLVYNSGYYLPFGGGSPGPRFLIPALPFLALPVALAFRRWPAATLGLGVASAVMLLTATATLPLLGNQDAGFWARLAASGNFENTVLSALGLGHGWLAIAPLGLAALGAAAAAALATGRVRVTRSDGALAVAALAGWGAVAAVAPDLLGRDADVTNTSGALALVTVAMACGLAAVGAAAAAAAPEPSQRGVT